MKNEQFNIFHYVLFVGNQVMEWESSVFTNFIFLCEVSFKTVKKD